MSMIVFLVTENGYSGLLTDIRVYDKDMFLEFVKSQRRAYGISYRVAKFGERPVNFKSLELKEFEELFDQEDIESLRLLLEYQKGKYPNFKKEICVKYGKEVV